MGFMVRCVGDMVPKNTRPLLPCGNGSQYTVTDISEYTYVFAVFLSVRVLHQRDGCLNSPTPAKLTLCFASVCTS